MKDNDTVRDDHGTAHGAPYVSAGRREETAERPASAVTSSTAAALQLLWAELGEGSVGVHERFIDFTDSISATEYANLVSKTFNVDIAPLTLLTDGATMADLAALIQARTGESEAVDEPSTPLATAAPAAASRADAPHLRALPGGQWDIWSTIAVRGAGFPTALLQRVAVDAATAAADRYAEARQRVTQHERPSWPNSARRFAARPRRSARLAGHNAARSSKGGCRLRRQRRPLKWSAALEASAQAYASFIAAYADDMRHVDGALQALAAEPRLREAAVWQNRGALAVARRTLARSDASPGDRRNAATFVAMLLQRYAAKNDSVGFFGPSAGRRSRMSRSSRTSGRDPDCWRTAKCSSRDGHRRPC